MDGEPSVAQALLAHAKHLYTLAGADEILSYVCVEARRLAGAERVVGSYIAAGRSWSQGLHVAPDQAGTPVPPEAVSAAFAIHRRLVGKPEPWLVPRCEEWSAVFRGLCGPENSGAVIWAVPIVSRRRRLLGQIVVIKRADILESSVMAAIGELASLASGALEAAERLSFARRDQDRLLLLAEATEEAVWDWNLDSNTFWWGGGIQNVIKTGAEVIGRTAQWKVDRIHPEDFVRVSESLKRVISSNDPSWREEYRFRRGDGSWAVVEDRAHLLRDASGKAYRVMGLLRDISEKKWLELQQGFLVQASAVLAESMDTERNLETVAQLAATTVADWCSIILLNQDGRSIRTVSVGHREPEQALALRQALHDSPEPQADWIVGTTEPRVIEAFTHAHRDGIVDRVPFLAPMLDRISPRSMLLVPILTGSKVTGWVTLLTSGESMRSYREADLTLAEEFARRCSLAVDKARLYEEAQNAIRARDAFMAILGHELRNPLSPITTALHLMKLRDPRATREHEVIERQVKHLARLVDDLLDVSRIERGKLELSKRPLKLAEVVANAVEIASPLLEDRRHRLELDLPASDLMLLGDEMRLTQVVANLLTNAARYTDEGGTIVVTAGREAQSVVLRVRDNGIGMPPELIPRVFELFVQGPRTADRKQGGLGLGLSLVRSLVSLHGGTVEAHSDGVGMGSEFTVRLPMASLSLVPSEVQLPAWKSPSETSRRILLVDDNTDAAELLAELLRLHGHEVLVAHDGPQALTAAPPFEPQIAILDIGLPVMDGYELARRLVGTLARTPLLIALTGYGQEHDRIRAREAGFDEHLVKPVDPKVLLTLLENPERRLDRTTAVLG
ncbi:MAG: ATP-binding protein [Archangium sp.]